MDLITRAFYLGSSGGGVTPSDNWIVTVGGSGSDAGYAVDVNSSGDVYVAAQTASAGAGSNDGWIGKFDSQANEQWQRTLGSTDSEQLNGIGLDSSGNVYVSGYSQGVGAGNYDGIVAKYNSSGTLQWQRTLGGSLQEFFVGSTVDSSGNVYISGQTSSTGEGSYDALFVKYNSSGTLQWQRILGDTNSNVGRGAALDSSGNVYFSGQDVATSTMVIKYNSSGTLQWQRAVGQGDGNDVAVDSSGNVYCVGEYNPGGPDFKITKHNSSGTFQFQKIHGGSSACEGEGICVDSSGNVYAVGNIGGNVLIIKYNSSGTLQWQRTLGGTGTDEGYAITHDGSGNIIITGETNSAGAGNKDILIAKLPDDGSLTGTYGSFTYAASSLTATSASAADSTPAMTGATSSLTGGTPSMTSSSASLSQSTEYL